MNIRPRILKAATGVKFSSANAGGANWRQQVFNNYRQHLLDQLAAYGEGNDYGEWLNEMQHRHSQLYNRAKQSGDWESTSYEDPEVGKYQHDYRGSQRFGNIKLNPNYNYDFNTTGILPNQNTRYNIPNPPKRTSGDFSREGFNYNPDNMYSAITDDRRILGRKGDWDENSAEFKQWNSDLNKYGWETYLDNSDNYYKLRRIPTPGNTITTPGSPTNKRTQITPQHRERYGFDWSKLGQGLQKVLGNPDLLAAGRFAGNLINNERVFDESIKGINPDLKSSYHTHRQVVGDEATKQQFYRRAVQGEQRAAKPFTSDADRQIAYQMEAKRIGDELRAQGDLADNQEIRRTSDESNQHQWANTQRDTEVANVNRASINQANALRHNLLAQKHSAQWSSFDNFLQGIEYRKRQQLAQQEALDDQIFALQEQQDLQNDPEYLQAYKTYSDVIKAHTNPTTGNVDINDEVIEAKRKFQQAQTNAAIRSYQRKKQYNQNRGTLFGKSGTKITYKKKDDLLYKSAKDVVEHFRKMSKISSDAQNRKKPKIEKLASHPKGSTKKYQQGGVAPFTVYKPLALGGETTTATETGSTNTTSKSSKEGYEQDLLKELFKSLQTEGLPSDVNGIFQAMNALMQRSQLFGTELSASDIQNMYLQQMQKLNAIKFNKAQYDKVQEIVNSKDAGSEFAVDQYGRIAVQDQEGKVSYIKWSELKKNFDKYNPLHNSDLLSLRAYSPDQAFNSNILQVASNATSMSEIAKFLKGQLPNIGQSEQTIEGYTKQDSNLIKAGLQILKDAPAGDYKFSEYTKDQKKQAQMALNYLKGILPNNMKTLLQVNSEMQGISPDALIASMVSSTLDSSYKFEVDAVTGKASDKEGDLDKLEINSATQLLLGMSSPREFTFSIGNGNVFNGMARVSSITKDGNSVGADFVYSDIYKSDLHKNLDLDNASFGDVPINKALKDRIIVDNSTIAGVDLPYTTDRNGRIIPDFKMLNRIEEADQEILRIGINPETEPQKVNEIYAKHNLPIKYGADNRLTGNYKRFAVIQATAIEDVFLDKSGLASNGTLSLVSDEEEINKYINEIKKTTGEKEIDMDRPGLGTGDKDIYKGSIFIPIIGDLVDAVSTTGGLKAGNYDELRSKYQTKNYNEAPQFVKQ